MTVFNVSLFLPHTVNFFSADGSTSNRRPSTPRPSPPIRRQSSAESKRNDIFARKGSSSASPRPAALKDQAKIFSTPEVPQLERPAPPRQSHTFIGGQQDGPPLAPSDPHSPQWGSRGAFNQPKARPVVPLTPSILQRDVPPLDAGAKPVNGGSPDRSESLDYSHSPWDIQPSEQGNGGLRNAVRSAVDEGYLDDKLWVGTLGMPTDALDSHTRDSIAEKLEVDYDCLTVFANDSDFDGHYTHFCKTILWPVFHYQIPDNPKDKAYEDHSWVYYINVNQAFADRIVRNWKRGDIVWIHDYHLLLVPNMVRKQLPDAQIGFFLHVAFPSSEVFRCLHVRKELLQGVLGANLVGFQTDEYCHHFLQTCSRILAVEATNQGIQLEDHFVNVGTFPIGIDPKSLDLRRQADDVKAWIETIKDKYQGKRLVVARDKLDHVRGVRQKLLAYELFLNKYPKWRDTVVLIQTASPSAEQPEIDATVSDIATRVNSTHSNLAHQPLVFLKQDLLFDQHLALLMCADTFMVTSLREGMNLTSHEFIHCQDGRFSDSKHGSLILSEFTGSASVFEDHPLLVNPWDYKQCAEALNTALEMSPEERERQWNKLDSAVTHHTTTNWVKTFLEKLSKVWEEQAQRETVAVPRLSVNKLSAMYKLSSRRLFIVDYEGTLASWGSPTSIVLTTPKWAIDTLSDLLEDPRNTVYVTSSRKPEEMERLFRPVQRLGLIAENGCFVREPQSEEWIKLFDDEETESWKDSLRDMMNYFSERTEGSWIENRHASLVFHYANAEDLQTAERHAADCANHINESCQDLDVRAMQSEGSVVVEPCNPNKGTAASHIFERILRKGKQADPPVPGPDFMLVIGDGRDDEVAFRWANKLAETKQVKNLLTVTLGSKSTEAMATLTQGVTGVLSCLGKLAAISRNGTERANSEVWTHSYIG